MEKDLIFSHLLFLQACSPQARSLVLPTQILMRVLGFGLAEQVRQEVGEWKKE